MLPITRLSLTKLLGGPEGVILKRTSLIFLEAQTANLALNLRI